MATAEFEQTESDFAEFQRHHVRRSRMRWRFLVPVAIFLSTGLLMALLATPLLVLKDTSGSGLILGGGSLVLVSMAAFSFLYAWFVAPALASVSGLWSQEARAAALGRRAVAVSPQGVSWRHPVGEGAVTWAGVNRIERDAAAVYIYFTAANAIWVPVRAFGSPEDLDRFAEVAERFWSDARSGSVM